MLLTKVKNSLAFRLPVAYKLFLTRLNAKAVLASSKPAAEYNLILLCGPDQLDMLQICLASVFRQFSIYPQILVFADLNSNVHQVQKRLAHFPEGYIKIVSGLDCISYHKKQGRDLLVCFAEKNPMGLKLAAVLQAIEMGSPVLYCDTDVMWFGDPYETIQQHLCHAGFSLAMSEDFQPAYDKNLIDKAGLNMLLTPPYFCAGIMLIKNLEDRHYATLNSLLEIVSEKSNHFSEQTIFAFLNRQTDNIAFDNNLFMIKTDDQFGLLPRTLPGVIARHYIGPVRHLFWRDAFWMGRKTARNSTETSV
jgi:hypothetical protein